MAEEGSMLSRANTTPYSIRAMKANPEQEALNTEMRL
jgi:hypothetical protein